MDGLEIRDVTAADLVDVTALIVKVFAKYVGPGFAPAGVDNFLAFVEPAAISLRLAVKSFMLTARCRGQLVGVVEVSDGHHIALLFVNEAFHRRGIGRRLVEAALARCELLPPGELTVNSSPYAVPVYGRLGFCRLGPEEEKDGIRFVPMALNQFLAYSLRRTNDGKKHPHHLRPAGS